MNKSSFCHNSLPAILLAVLALQAAPLLAAERLIPFQGRVSDGAGAALQGVYRVTFSIYDAPSGGTPLWIETHENVSILAGQINIMLGSLTPLDDPDRNGNTSDAVSFAGNLATLRHLGIKVGEDTNQEMVPRHELVPSFHARVADTTVPGAIGTEQLADGAVTTIKMGPTAGVPVGAVVMWWGEAVDIPEGFEVCDGTLPTTPGALLTAAKPDLQDRIPLGVGTLATMPGDTGGSVTSTTGSTTLSSAQVPSHEHGSGGTHNHGRPGAGGTYGIGFPPNANTCAVFDPINSSGGHLDFSAPLLDTIFTWERENLRQIFGSQVMMTSALDLFGTYTEDCDVINGGPTGGHTHNSAGGGQSHSHSQERSAYLAMHFIIRVK